MGAIVAGRPLWTPALAALFAIGSVGGFGTPARAQVQVQRSGEPPEAAQTNQAAQANQATLTGDWGGLRSYLARNGITFTLNYTNDFLANVAGGIKPGAVGIGVFQPQLDIDMGKLAGLEVVISTPMASSPTGLFSARRILAIFWRRRIRSGARGAALFVLVRTECLQ